MASSEVGSVESGSGRSYDVKWDSSSGSVYVSYSGWKDVGTASSVREAMRKAEAWLYNK